MDKNFFKSSVLLLTLPQHIPSWAIWTGLLLFTINVGAITILSMRLMKYQECKAQHKFLDQTTGIGNIAYFKQEFEYFFDTRSKLPAFVAYIDFDISHINKYYGYDESENILHYAANILSASAAEDELLSRINSGGFALAFRSTGEEAAVGRISALLDSLNGYSDAFRRDEHIKFFAGICPVQNSEQTAETVLHLAFQGCSYASEHKMNIFCLTKDLQLTVEETARRQREIANALTEQQFQMYLQFIVDKSGQVCGAEALSRWEHPQKGLLYPGYYISIMEQVGNIEELDFYMFDKVCEQLQTWKRLKLTKLSLSCNFTRLTISSESFMKRIHQISRNYNFDHSKLIIEITEDTTIRNEKLAHSNILACKKLGFLIALDDFGEGYTSFHNLCDYPIDYIKIDKNIVQKAENPNVRALLDGMIALGHNMNMKILCEGVETEEMNEIISQTGCDLIQGFYFFRAIHPKEAEKFLLKKRNL